MSESIKVIVRVRPINSKQLARNCEQIITADQQNNTITIFKPEQPQNVKVFTYDYVFNAESEQKAVYANAAYHLVENVLEGYNGTIFAYGQTGCGKTHSMVGRTDIEQLQGIIPRSFGHILNSINETKNKQFLIRCSFIEIYNEQVRDLLGKDVKKSLQIKQSPEKGVFIKDLSSNPAKSHEQLMNFMNIGNKNRSVGETAMNKDSSRSHLLFMLYVQSADLSLPEQKRKYIGSKLNLVDLAGSERINKTGAQGDRLQEAKNINLSLSALGNVISALVDGKSHHIPYRDSKLTRLLQDSLGGNTKTVMIANCSPADYNFDESLSTLRYASRAKLIKNKPIINEDPKDALLKQYANEIKKLKQILEKEGKSSAYIENNGQGTTDIYNLKLKEKEIEIQNQRQQTKKLQRKLEQLQKQHLYSQKVQIDEKIRQKVKEVRQSAILNSHNSPMQRIKSQEGIQKPKKNDESSEKQLIKKIKYQIKALQNEITDVSHENYLDKEAVLNDIRELSRENKLLQGILHILLSPAQVQAIKRNSQNVEKESSSFGYDDNSNSYRVPHFGFKQKQLALPKINNMEYSQAGEYKLNGFCNGSKKIMSNKSSVSIQDGENIFSQKQNEIIGKCKIISKFNNNSSLGLQFSRNQSMKNNSIFYSKVSKENKRDVNSVRGLLQEAREVHQHYVPDLNPPIKNPSTLYRSTRKQKKAQHYRNRRRYASDQRSYKNQLTTQSQAAAKNSQSQGQESEQKDEKRLVRKEELI